MASNIAALKTHLGILSKANKEIEALVKDERQINDSIATLNELLLSTTITAEEKTEYAEGLVVLQRQLDCALSDKQIKKLQEELVIRGARSSLDRGFELELFQDELAKAYSNTSGTPTMAQRIGTVADILRKAIDDYVTQMDTIDQVLAETNSILQLNKHVAGKSIITSTKGNLSDAEWQQFKGKQAGVDKTKLSGYVSELLVLKDEILANIDAMDTMWLAKFRKEIKEWYNAVIEVKASLKQEQLQTLQAGFGVEFKSYEKQLADIDKVFREAVHTFVGTKGNMADNLKTFLVTHLHRDPQKDFITVNDGDDDFGSSGTSKSIPLLSRNYFKCDSNKLTGPSAAAFYSTEDDRYYGDLKRPVCMLDVTDPYYKTMKSKHKEITPTWDYISEKVQMYLNGNLDALSKTTPTADADGNTPNIDMFNERVMNSDAKPSADKCNSLTPCGSYTFKNNADSYRRPYCSIAAEDITTDLETKLGRCILPTDHKWFNREVYQPRRTAYATEHQYRFPGELGKILNTAVLNTTQSLNISLSQANLVLTAETAQVIVRLKDTGSKANLYIDTSTNTPYSVRAIAKALYDQYKGHVDLLLAPFPEALKLLFSTFTDPEYSIAAYSFLKAQKKPPTPLYLFTDIMPFVDEYLSATAYGASEQAHEAFVSAVRESLLYRVPYLGADPETVFDHAKYTAVTSVVTPFIVKETPTYVLVGPITITEDMSIPSSLHSTVWLAHLCLPHDSVVTAAELPHYISIFFASMERLRRKQHVDKIPMVIIFPILEYGSSTQALLSTINEHHNNHEFSKHIHTYIHIGAVKKTLHAHVFLLPTKSQYLLFEDDWQQRYPKLDRANTICVLAEVVNGPVLFQSDLVTGNASAAPLTNTGYGHNPIFNPHVFDTNTWLPYVNTSLATSVVKLVQDLVDVWRAPYIGVTPNTADKYTEIDPHGFASYAVGPTTHYYSWTNHTTTTTKPAAIVGGLFMDRKGAMNTPSQVLKGALTSFYKVVQQVSDVIETLVEALPYHLAKAYFAAELVENFSSQHSLILAELLYGVFSHAEIDRVAKLEEYQSSTDPQKKLSSFLQIESDTIRSMYEDLTSLGLALSFEAQPPLFEAIIELLKSTPSTTISKGPSSQSITLYKALAQSCLLLYNAMLENNHTLSTTSTPNTDAKLSLPLQKMCKVSFKTAYHHSFTPITDNTICIEVFPMLRVEKTQQAILGLQSLVMPL